MSVKFQYIDLFVAPGLGVAAQILRAKDANTTGTDDLAADVFDYAGKAYQAVKLGLPMPDLPESLRPKPAPEEAEATT